jgi:aryl-alcohol dehydrogenase-like predicted oxidoreductase
LPENDHRSRDPKFLPPQREINLQFVEALRPLADRQGRSVGELAIAWVLRRPEVTSAIVGARRPEQLDGVVGAAGWNWDAADFAFIDERLQARDAALRAAIA